jgi:hypothetical protein
MVTRNRAQNLAGSNSIARVHTRRDRLVLGHEAVGMPESDDATTGHHSRENDDAWSGCAHRFARPGLEIDAAVTCGEPRRRWREPPNDPDAPVKRQAVPDGDGGSDTVHRAGAAGLPTHAYAGGIGYPGDPGH